MFFESQSFGDLLHLSVNGNYFNTDGYVRPITSEAGPIDLPARSETNNLHVTLGITPSKTMTGYVRANVYDFDQNQGSPLGADGQHTDDIDAGFRRTLDNGGQLSASVFAERDRFHTENTDPITIRGHDEFISNAHHTPGGELGGSVQWTRMVGQLGFVTGGADARRVTGEDQSINYSAPGTFSFTDNGGGAQNTVGLFAEGDFFVRSRLEVLPSARFDDWENLGGHDNKSPGTDRQFPNRSKARVNPKLALKYAWTDNLSLRASVYSAFNAPTLDNLYRSFSASSFAIIANPQLGPETLTGGEAGIDYRMGSAQLQVNVFQSELKDVIAGEAVSYSPVYTIQDFNVGRSRSRGVELITDLHIAPSVDFAPSVTLYGVRSLRRTRPIPPSSARPTPIRRRSREAARCHSSGAGFRRSSYADGTSARGSPM